MVERAAQPGGCVADFVGKLNTVLVRIFFIVAGKLVVEDVAVGALRESRNQRLPHTTLGTDFIGSEADSVALLHRVDGVSGRDVNELVAENTSKLRFVLHQPEEALGDEDKSAWCGEGIDAFRVQNDELPPQVRFRAHLREDVADERYVFGDRSVLKDPESRNQLRADLFANLALFRIGDAQVGKLLHLLGVVDRAIDCAKLGPRGCGDRQRNERECEFLHQTRFLPARSPVLQAGPLTAAATVPELRRWRPDASCLSPPHPQEGGYRSSP